MIGIQHLELVEEGKATAEHEYPYRIYTKCFPDGDDRKVIFGVKQNREKKIIYLSSLELFYNDNLIRKFSPFDVREIAYTAAWEMFLLEKEMMKQL